MPPITRPASKKSNRSMATASRLHLRFGRSGPSPPYRRSLERLAEKKSRVMNAGPGRWSAMYRLLQARLGRARQVRWGDTAIFPILPLPDPPDLAQHAGFELGLAENGFEGAGLDRLDNLGAVDLAHLFDGLLQHLQGGVGVGARPAVRLLAGEALVPGEPVLDAGSVGVPGAETEGTLDLVGEFRLVVGKGDPDAQEFDLRAEIVGD